MAEPVRFSTMTAAAAADTLAPDGSEIRFLPQLRGGSMVHCRLPPGTVTKAIRHKTVEEIWYVLGGAGEIWRKCGQEETITPLRSGVALTIPLGTDFQFRAAPDTDLEPNTGLEIVIVTMPPWPNDQEAEAVVDFWPRDTIIV